jgi:hypothetical protein
MLFRLVQRLCLPTLFASECQCLYERQIYKILRLATWRALSFWHGVAIITDALLLTAFILRVIGLDSLDEKGDQIRLHSFQVLSFVSPVIWCVLVCLKRTLSGPSFQDEYDFPHKQPNLFRADVA